MSKGLSQRPWERVKTRHKKACKQQNLPCWLCLGPIDYQLPTSDTMAFESDHYWPRKTHPHLAYDITNLRPSHQQCNRSRKNTMPGTWTQAEQW